MDRDNGNNKSCLHRDAYLRMCEPFEITPKVIDNKKNHKESLTVTRRGYRFLSSVQIKSYFIKKLLGKEYRWRASCDESWIKSNSDIKYFRLESFYYASERTQSCATRMLFVSFFSCKFVIIGSLPAFSGTSSVFFTFYPNLE